MFRPSAEAEQATHITQVTSGNPQKSNRGVRTQLPLQEPHTDIKLRPLLFVFKRRRSRNLRRSLSSRQKVADVVENDTEGSMLCGKPQSAICVQRFDDSLNSAIRITYRISLRSSSLLEPRYPLLRVVQRFVFFFSYC